MRAATIALVLLLAACDDGVPLVVEVRHPRTGQPLAHVPVRLLPYDRQRLLDSLRQAAPQPEPLPPPELLARARSLERQLAASNPAADFLARVLAAVRHELDRWRAPHRAWSARTFAAFDSLARSAADASGRIEQADTTDAQGRAIFRAEPGRWWVYAYFVGPDSACTWTVPVDLAARPRRLVLTRAQARAQPVW
jgi:hypothetical protein